MGNDTITGSDGTERKAWYGKGRQPWDDFVRYGWAQDYAAACILKYLRRTKEPEHSPESARIYNEWLNKLCIDPNYPWASRAASVRRQLRGILTTDELAKLDKVA